MFKTYEKTQGKFQFQFKLSVGESKIILNIIIKNVIIFKLKYLFVWWIQSGHSDVTLTEIQRLKKDTYFRHVK